MIREAGEKGVYVFDSMKMKTDLQSNMQILYMASAIISGILFILTFFQLIVAISSNIRDSEWELGVLR